MTQTSVVDVVIEGAQEAKKALMTAFDFDETEEIVHYYPATLKALQSLPSGAAEGFGVELIQRYVAVYKDSPAEDHELDELIADAISRAGDFVIMNMQQQAAQRQQTSPRLITPR